jgi:hypothetical protein
VHNWNSLPAETKFAKGIDAIMNSLDNTPKLVELFYGVD